ncbi:MarR family transcriptional regulator [Brachybacterium sp. EF45031]|uniref:MarR family transcriptional regulator n=1 Tax=Brachybacterium sillae TaxID=2810536 RepID=UPI00217DBB19|nr:helix-turn-helix domain-containing protein [Brachybacterium sillae]MCS6710540.1 MarR family transcriptional regulator [Brachybacterium sillae]
MFVLLFTPPRRTARAGEDPVPELLRTLAPLGLRGGPERTTGREVIAVADRAGVALDALRAAREEGQWRVGLGIGEVPLPLPQDLRAVEGPAAKAARDALHEAATTSQVPVAIRAADPRQAGTAADAQAVLRLVGWMIATRNRGQWRVARAVRDHPEWTQQQLAAHLGITQQTVSRSLQTSGWREESAVHPLLERLLAMIDLTSASSRRP